MRATLLFTSIRLLGILLTCGLGASPLRAQPTPAWGHWPSWGEQPGGTYRNPIIPSDYSDLDCIRVGDDYYAITSTFQFSPGMTILHSRDLVNWELAGHAVADLTQIGPALSWDKMDRYGRGIWAGTLRHHGGRFCLYFGTPDEGYFMTSAPGPAGPWEPLSPVLAESGWDDCAVHWDERGQGWLVGTHFADHYKTYLFRLGPDNKTLDRKSAVLLNEGAGREANKLLKVGQYYYLIFSEHKDGVGRYVMAKRARRITGPYREEKQLALPSTEAMEPNQGGLVTGPDGQWYFLTHHGSGDWAGRQMSLLPVTWRDGWPLIGQIAPGASLGTMAWQGAMPAVLPAPHLSLARSDDFDAPALGPQWQWNYQPRSEMYSLQARAGWLRLKAYASLQKGNLLRAGNTLTQRTFRTAGSEVTVKLDVSHMADGQQSGLCHFSQNPARLGVVQRAQQRYLEFRHGSQTAPGPVLMGPHVWLRSTWGLDGLSHFSYSLDGDTYLPLGEPCQLMWSYYRGDRLGLYSFNDEGEKGFVDVDYFHYALQKNASNAGGAPSQP